MFPVLVIVYTRLARNEEREVAARLGATWAAYAACTPRFLPAALRHPLTAISRTRRRTEP
jgi:protein-S-isoprenylcysteine O-methyltransferase Ste14